MCDYIHKEDAINAIKPLISSIPPKDDYAKGYDAAMYKALLVVKNLRAVEVIPHD